MYVTLDFIRNRLVKLWGTRRKRELQNEQANSKNCGPPPGNKFDLEVGQRSRQRSPHGTNGKGLSQGSCMPNINVLSLIPQKIWARLKFSWQTDWRTDRQRDRQTDGRRLKCTIVIMRCPSVCLSVRPSVVNFSHFRLSSETAEQNSTKLHRTQDLNALYQVCVFRTDRKKTRWPPWPLIGWDIFDFSSETAERNSTKLDRKQDLNILYQVCVFRADQKNKMAALASDWLRHFRLLLWNCWTEFNETWQEARSQRPLPSLCFPGWSEKQDGRPGLWLAETFSTSFLKLLNRIQRNLTGSKISTSSTKFVFFGPIGKTRWLPWPLIGWDIFNFSSETAERNSTKLDRKQDLNILYQVCVFRADQKNKMAALASDWLRHFRLLFWNCWTEFNETWQEARSQRPLRSLCFSGRSEKTRWPPWPLIGWDIFNFSSETAEWNSTKLDRKQDLNILYRSLYFWCRSEKTRWLRWPIPQKGCTLYSGARYVALWASCFNLYLPAWKSWHACVHWTRQFCRYTVLPRADTPHVWLYTEIFKFRVLTWLAWPTSHAWMLLCTIFSGFLLENIGRGRVNVCTLRYCCLHCIVEQVSGEMHWRC